MSHYTTKSNIVERDYVVIRHGFRGMNATVMGVRFRDGWAVVQKGSKIYFRLSQLPMLKNLQERPLTFLRELPFINRPLDVKLVYGADVYAKYVTLDNKRQAEEIIQAVEEGEKIHIEDETMCKGRTKDDALCKHSVRDPSISDYCALHLLKDPRLQDLGFVIPKAMDNKERKKIRKAAWNKLKNNKMTKEIVDVQSNQTILPETEVEPDSVPETDYQISGE